MEEVKQEKHESQLMLQAKIQDVITLEGELYSARDQIKILEKDKRAMEEGEDW